MHTCDHDQTLSFRTASGQTGCDEIVLIYICPILALSVSSLLVLGHSVSSSYLGGKCTSVCQLGDPVGSLIVRVRFCLPQHLRLNTVSRSQPQLPGLCSPNEPTSVWRWLESGPMEQLRWRVGELEHEIKRQKVSVTEVPTLHPPIIRGQADLRGNQSGESAQRIPHTTVTIPSQQTLQHLVTANSLQLEGP